MEAGSSSHSFDEHTGEVLLRISAPTFAELLAEAGRALAELLCDEPARPFDDEERVALEAPDSGALLVSWLNELIFLSETKKRIYSDIRVAEASERHLVADVRGWPPTRLRTQVKAATFHRLSVTLSPGACTAAVVLDV